MMAPSANTPPKIGLLLPLRISAGASTLVFAFSLVINILMLAGPIFMLQVYDRVLTSGSLPTLVALLVLVGVLYLLFTILEAIRSQIMLQIANKSDHLLSQPAIDAVAENAIRGDAGIRSVPLSDIGTVRGFFASNGPIAFLDTPWTPIYLAAIYILHPTLGLFALIATMVLIAIAILNNFLTNRNTQTTAGHTLAAASLSEALRQNAKVARALGMMKDLSTRWITFHRNAVDSLSSSRNSASILGAISKGLRLFFQSAILAAGAWLAIQQEITPGAMIAGSILMARALAPIDQMIGHWQLFLEFRQSAVRLNQVFLKFQNTAGKFDLPMPKGKLQVTNVICRVPDRKEPLLQSINFSLEPGDGLGVIGATGSGKTTLAEILVGVGLGYLGKVELDGAELSQYDAQTIGSAIGYMPQEVSLFDGTIAENIARMAPSPDAEKVVEAAKLAKCHELITRLPQGYETRLVKGGANLSTGQRQRIGIARALYGHPALIVLDEPNANLDGEGERALVHALVQARQDGATVIVIAHRPSAVAALNKLLLLRDGHQAAFGPSQEILKQLAEGSQTSKKVEKTADNTSKPAQTGQNTWPQNMPANVNPFRPQQARKKPANN